MRAPVRLRLRRGLPVSADDADGLAHVADGVIDGIAPRMLARNIRHLRKTAGLTSGRRISGCFELFRLAHMRRSGARTPIVKKHQVSTARKLVGKLSIDYFCDKVQVFIACPSRGAVLHWASSTDGGGRHDSTRYKAVVKRLAKRLLNAAAPTWRGDRRLPASRRAQGQAVTFLNFLHTRFERRIDLQACFRSAAFSSGAQDGFLNRSL